MTHGARLSAGRIREAGDSALLMELAPQPAARGEGLDVGVNDRAVAAAREVEQRRLAGVRDVVSTFRSVAVFVDPLRADVPVVASVMGEAAGAEAMQAAGQVVDVPVAYGGDEGPDMAEVAAFAGCSEREVVERHSSRTYRVFMLGFLPGFAYLGTVDPTIAAPRKSTPRVRVPAGSVGIAGRQTGIYPRESPGGWQIVGRTLTTLFDAAAASPALLAAGDEVRFVPVSAQTSYIASGSSRTEARLKADLTHPSRSITVLRPGLLTTIQDAGRWGYQNLGVPVAGPMDAVAHRRANLMVGNTLDAAGLEATLVGPELRFEQETWIAIAGADLQPSLDGADVPGCQAVKCRAGSVLRFGARRSGARAYVAFSGGIATPLVLGSRATDVRSGLGGLDGRALRAGDRIPLGAPHGEPRPRAAAPRRDPAAAPSNGARLRILPGPQIDYFDAAAIERLQGARHILTPQSDRMGYRLTGGAAFPAPPTGEMISDAAFIGGLQVLPSGDPILLMVDRQTIGGYPQIGVVITADIPLAAQLRPGDWVEFHLCSRPDAIAALAAQSEAIVDLG